MIDDTKNLPLRPMSDNIKKDSPSVEKETVSKTNKKTQQVAARFAKDMDAFLKSEPKTLSRNIDTYPLSHEIQEIINNYPGISESEKKTVEEKLSKTYYAGIHTPYMGGRREMLLQKLLGTQVIPADAAERSKGTYLLWRGLRDDQLVMMVINGSAGNQKADPNASAPSEASSILQVGEKESLPEFTTNPAIAEQFGTNHNVCVFRLRGRDLTPGSGTEAGYIVNQNAPAELILYKKGRGLTI